jgi:hypothetical protein
VKEIKEIVRQVGGPKCSIVCYPREEPKALRVFRSNDNGLISPEVRENTGLAALNLLLDGKRLEKTLAVRLFA